jgi:hypothetical protein
VPDFVAMAVDLRYCGYKPLDALRIYGFNLLLLPVNLAGSLSSIVQALTGPKGRFMRTPKVSNRTVPAFIYVVLPYVLVAFSAYTFRRAYVDHQWTDVVFARINAVLGAHAIVAFTAIRNSLVDIWELVLYTGFADRRRRERPVLQVATQDPDRPVMALPLLTAPSVEDKGETGVLGDAG